MIAEEVRNVIKTFVELAKDRKQEGMLVPTAQIVQIVRLAGYESTSDKQMHEYVSYVLRESLHVCRYATGVQRSERFIHVADECSESCKAIDVHTPRDWRPPLLVQIPYNLCQHCNMRLPNNAACGYCE